MNGDQMKKFMMYAEGIARGGGCFEYSIDDSGRIRSWLLEEGAIRRYLLAYADFVLLDGTHWVNKYGQIRVPPVVVSCFGRSITGAIIVAPAEDSEPIIEHLAQAGLGMSDPAKREVLMTGEGPAFPACNYCSLWQVATLLFEPLLDKCQHRPHWHQRRRWQLY